MFGLIKFGHAVHFCVTRYRKIGLSDWTASLVCIIAISFTPFAFVAWESGLEYFHINWQHAGIASLIIIGLASVPTLYILRLRAAGITDADFHIQSGINYREALESAPHGFSFLGIGATKLRDEENALREAFRLAQRANSEIKFLLLDPSSPGAIESMERADETRGYKEKVEGSISFIRRLSESMDNVAKVHQYSAATVKDVEPFRLFITEEACLVSPFVTSTGVKDQGRNLPQLRISRKGIPRGGNPTLYNAFKGLYERSWQTASSESQN